MKLRLLPGVLLFASFASATPVRAAAPGSVLQPSGPWSVEYAQSMCVLSRPFGTGEQRLIFGFKPAPYADQARLFLIRQAGREPRGIGKADIRLSDGSRPSWANFMSASAKGLSLTSIDVPRSSLEPLFDGGSIAIRVGKRIDVALAPTGMRKAVEALAKCETDLLKSWGMDEAEQAALAALPVSNVHGLFRSDDYPMDLLERGVQGSVGFLMIVDAAGALQECRVIETSGTPALDEATCAVIRRRGRFQPAQDHQGKPMAALTYQRVNWQIAGGYSYELQNDLSAPAAMLPSNTSK